MVFREASVVKRGDQIKFGELDWIVTGIDTGTNEDGAVVALFITRNKNTKTIHLVPSDRVEINV